METPRRLDESLAATGQIEVADLAAVAGAGFRTVINARPDGEQPGQPASAVLAEAARAAGLAYRHLPVRMATLSGADVAAFEAAVAELPGPVLAFCRSGTRAAALWAWSQARSGSRHGSPAQALETARAAGFDLADVHSRIHADVGKT